MLTLQNQILPLYLMKQYKTTLFCLIKSFQAQYHIFACVFVPVYFTQSGFGTGFVSPLAGSSVCFTQNYFHSSAYLIGISNCTWSSCRHGCTAEVYKCWQVQVNFTLVPKSHPIPPPWGSLTSFTLSKSPVESQPARLYPNVRGCGYPPQLQCQG